MRLSYGMNSQKLYVRRRQERNYSDDRILIINEKCCIRSTYKQASLLVRSQTRILTHNLRILRLVVP